MNPRPSTDADLLDVGAAVFHGHVSARDDNGQYSGVGYSGQKFHAALTAYPYGFRSYAPLNTGLVLTHSPAGLLVLSQEGNLPEGVTEPLSGEALLYNAQGCQVHLDANGDVKVMQKSGRFVNMGSSPEFVALASLVNTEMDRIQRAHDLHKHPTAATGPPSVPDTLLTTMGAVDASEVKGT